jgi:hypothetical protein
VWAIVSAAPFPTQLRGSLAIALRHIQGKPQGERQELAAIVSRWLQRFPLTPAQASRVGLRPRIDWEGELVPVVADLLRAAVGTGMLRTLFLLIDQLEDLFTPTFSELRRARILTDLRGLVDEIEADAPVGLLLAWTPDFGTSAGRPRGRVETLFQSKYEALYSRMERRRVDLPLLGHEHAKPFADEWVNAAKEEPGFDPDRQPGITEVAQAAWSRLERTQGLFPGGKATPREFLASLADEVDRLAGLR